MSKDDIEKQIIQPIVNRLTHDFGESNFKDYRGEGIYDSSNKRMDMIVMPYLDSLDGTTGHVVSMCSFEKNSNL